MFSKSNVKLIDLDSVAQDLSQLLKGGDVVLFVADIGAGKTTLISKIAKALGVTHTVTSPTFAIVETYDCYAESALQGTVSAGTLSRTSEESIRKLIHIDTYRLTHVNELYDLGFETIFNDEALTLVEWGERIEEFIDKDHYVLTIEEVDDETRNISLKYIEVSNA